MHTRGNPYVYTDHPAADLLETGGVVRPTRSAFLVVPIKGATWPFGKAGFFTTRPRDGRERVVLHRRRRGVFAVFKRFVIMRPTGWQAKSREEIGRGEPDRIADTVLDLRELGLTKAASRWRNA